MSCIDFTKIKINLDAVPFPSRIPKELRKHLRSQLSLVGEWSEANLYVSIKLGILASRIGQDRGVLTETFIGRASCGHKFCIALAPEFNSAAEKINRDLRLANFGGCKCKPHSGVTSTPTLQ